MIDIFKSIVTLLIAVVGFIGGIIWFYQSDWDMEPLILIVVSFIEIIAYFFIKQSKEEKNAIKIKNQQVINNAKGVKKQYNIQNYKGDIKL